MDKKFHKLNKLLQIILLLIPVVNWFVEILVRWSAYVKNGGVLRLLISVIVTLPCGIIIGWLDALGVVFTNKLILE